MKGFNIGLIVCLSSITIGCTASYIYFSATEQVPPTTEGSGENNFVIEETPKTNKELFMENILASSIRVNELELNLKEIDSTHDLKVNFVGALDYDGLAMATGDMSSIKGNGELSVSYDDINESIYFIYPNDGTLYFTYRNTDLSIKLDSFNSILDLLPMFGAEEGEDSFNETDIFEVMTEYLNSIEERVIDENTIEYSLVIPGYGGIILESDGNHLLKSIYTIGDFEIEGQKISLHADVNQDKVGTFTETEINNDYVKLDNLPNIVNTIVDLSNSKQVDANFALSLNNIKDNSEIVDLNGNLIIDYSEATCIEEGKYSININNTGSILGKEQVNTLESYYENNNFYFVLNNLFKGKIGIEEINDIYDIVDSYLNTSDEEINNALDEFNSYFESSAFASLLNGDLSAIYEIINNVVVSENSLHVSINADAFGLGEFIFNVGINYDEVGLNSIEISNFIVENYSIDFSLNLEKYAGFAEIFSELGSFKDYNQATKIYHTISNLVDSKKVSVDYNIDLFSENNGHNNFNGGIAFDLNGVNFNDLNSLNNGKYELSLNTTLNNMERNIKLNYLNNYLFANYNDYFKGKMSNAEISDIYNFVDSIISRTQATGSVSSDLNYEEIMNSLDSYLEELKTKYNELIEGILNYDLRVIENYVDIDKDNLNSDLLKIDLYPDSKEGNYKVSFELSTIEESLKTISLSGLKVNDLVMNVSLSLNDYEEIFVNENEYSDLDNLTSSLMSLDGKTKFNVGFAGNLVQNSTNSVTSIDGQVQADIDNGSYYGNVGLVAKLPTDTNPYRHNIDFDYYKDEALNDDNLMIKYYGIRNYVLDDKDVQPIDNSDNPMRAKITKGSIFDVYDAIVNIPEDSVLNYLLTVATDVVSTIDYVVETPSAISGLDDIIKTMDEVLLDAKVTDNSLYVKLNGEKFGLNSEIEVTINYGKDSMESIVLSVKELGDYSFNLTINLFDFDSEFEGKRLSISDINSTYFDFNSLKLLLSVGINTTRTHTYELKGEFVLDVPTIGELVQSDIENYITIKININEGTGKVNGFIELKSFDEVRSGLPKRVTRFYILDNDDCIIEQVRGRSEWHFNWFNSYYTYHEDHDVFKVTNQEMMDNLVYYLLKYTLDMEDDIYNQIDKAMNSEDSSENSDSSEMMNFVYENIITNYQYVENVDSPETYGSSVTVNRDRFDISINMANMINLGSVTANCINLQTLNISLYKDENDVMRRLHLYGDAMSLIVIGSVSLNLDVYNNVNNSLDMSEYDEFLASYNSNDSLLKGYYYYKVDESQMNSWTVDLGR